MGLSSSVTLNMLAESLGVSVSIVIFNSAGLSQLDAGAVAILWREDHASGLEGTLNGGSCFC